MEKEHLATASKENSFASFSIFFTVGKVAISEVVLSEQVGPLAVVEKVLRKYCP